MLLSYVEATTIGAAVLWYALVLGSLAPLQRLRAQPVVRRRVDAVTGAALLTVAGLVALR